MEVDVSDQIVSATKILHEGGVVAYPTESCFGLGCDPHNDVAVQRILSIKQRSWEKGLILIADCVDRLKPYISIQDTSLYEKIESHPKEPVSWVCPASIRVSNFVKGVHDTIAVRVTRHLPAAILCQSAEMALVSTSANVAGQSPLISSQEVKRTFGDSVDFILDAPIGSAARPSSVIDLFTGEVFRK